MGAVTLLAGCLDAESEADPSDSPESEAVEPGPPFEIRTIEARGSERGTISVPDEGIVQVLHFARSYCPTSEGQTENVAEAMSESNEERVRFVTINDWSGPADTDAELAEWWAENTVGDWLLGVDESASSTDYYEIVPFPTTIVIDGSGEVYHRGSGGTSSSNISYAVETALESETGENQSE
ncbi:hypothetical protein [Halostagnicola sp. A56]|uniref:TlpA family protein disulfide reductase n=1 Tax=Halostagnicola sp. A56 TaxID=1495067 RepID=UPI000679CB5A|nr:hypothetical protein [Halostagnicola sp. A56]